MLRVKKVEKFLKIIKILNESEMFNGLQLQKTLNFILDTYDGPINISSKFSFQDPTPSNQ